MKQHALQTMLRIVYPPRCTLCGGQVDSEFALCGPCWRDTPFIGGLCCDACGVPLLGDDDAEAPVLCDECLHIARPWDQGRAALLYKDNGRALVLALKHGDRHEIVRPAASWMAQAAKPIWMPQTLIAPIPLHWFRMVKRTFNQSALLSKAVARVCHSDHCPDLLLRRKNTKSLKGLSLDERFATLDQAIVLNPKHRDTVKGRNILLIDDVMSSGATFSAAAQACIAAGADRVCVLALARAMKDD